MNTPVRRASTALAGAGILIALAGCGGPSGDEVAAAVPACLEEAGVLSPYAGSANSKPTGEITRLAVDEDGSLIIEVPTMTIEAGEPIESDDPKHCRVDEAGEAEIIEAEEASQVSGNSKKAVKGWNENFADDWVRDELPEGVTVEMVRQL